MPAVSDPPSGNHRPPGVRRGVLAAAVTALALVAAVGVYWLTGRPSAPVGPGEETAAVATQPIVRTDLSARDQLPGAIGFGPPRTVKSAREGTVTWLPAAGARIERGQQLFRVDDMPVPLFYGPLPLYRTLDTVGMIGRDVKIVAENLNALGYRVRHQPDTGEKVSPQPSAGGAPVKVRDGEGVYTAELQKAVRLWQRATGLPETGTIAAGDVAVQGGAVRVDSVTAQTGDPAASALLTVTATGKVITLLAEPVRASSIRRGDQVVVNLPDGTAAAGHVSAVGAGTTTPPDGAGEQKIAVTVVTKDPAAADGLDRADVTVDLNAQTRAGVLAVRVGALLALREGGYAVQLADGPLIAVQVGIFAGGLVEVSGDGLAEGALVVTSS
ncbi:peptidoglycan-binding protein [Plantactinospora mayteni]|uniref:Peptidoglycan-binding protein n=2 Tax=Plantactinospora mayteni TaxID=566021 RepID=A0ABQ4F3N3_9ACTN|nr:peptidoglycan-binding protein [Plantactinospora mayteni]